MAQWRDAFRDGNWGFVILRKIGGLVVMERVNECNLNGNRMLWSYEID